MLAFYSNNYFLSEYCFKEWQIFKEFQSRGSNSQKLLIPIEVKPVETKYIGLFSEEKKCWFDELTSSGGVHRNISSQSLLSLNTAELSREVKTLNEVIQAHILRQKGTTPEKTRAPNIVVFESKIEGSTLYSPKIKHELSEKNGTLRYNSLPICIIYTGGTVGMVRIPESDELHSDYEMVRSPERLIGYLYPRISGLSFNMHFFSLMAPIDSSNASASDWNRLAQLIQEQMDNYQGFVILHGTNTIAYTASALSFLLADVIKKPVILTGSEVPLSVPNTDAIHNIENAIRAASWQSHNGPMLVPEVCVYWNNHLFRGNRVTKKYASDRTDGFHTPNMATPLATLTHDKLIVEYSLIRRPSEENALRQQRLTELNARVEVLFLHPDMDYSGLLDRYKNLDGLLLLSYGSGNAPESQSFIKLIDNLIKNGVIVANVTQCPYGKVELKLFETSATLFDLGVVDGDDMTLEAAYCKLIWAISKYGNRRQKGVQSSIKSTFQRNYAGEMSVNIFSISLGSHDSFASVGDTGFIVSDTHRFDKEFSPYDISDAFLRLEGFKIVTKSSKLRLKILYGCASVNIEECDNNDNILVDFTKVSEGKNVDIEFNKNLEISHAFRKLFKNDYFQLSIGVIGASRFDFSSIKIVVYTKDRMQ